MGSCLSESSTNKADTAAGAAASAAVHKLVILGAGFGGNAVISGLTTTTNGNDDLALLPPNLSVAMVDRKTTFSIGATWQFHWSSRFPSSTPPEWPLVDLQANRVPGVHLWTDTLIERVDTDAQQVHVVRMNHKETKTETLDYDTLVVTPGVVSDPTLVPGLSDDNCPVLDICNKEHVPIIRERIDQVLQEAKELSSGKKKTILMCVTRMPYKCPPVPFEVVSVLDDLRRERGVLDQVDILLSVPVPFPFAGPPAAKVFKPLLQEQGIQYLPNHHVTHVEGSTIHFEIVPSEGEAKSADNEETKTKQITADLVLATFPQRAPDFCKPLCNPKGLIPVDLQTNKVQQKGTAAVMDNVYAIGDACHTMFPKPNKPHPKAGEFAYLMGLHVADQIQCTLQGKEQPSPPERKASCVAECGVDGRGVNIQPNFTKVLADPPAGLPMFDFPIVQDAAGDKTIWVNGYIDKFFGVGKVPAFGAEST